MATWSLRLRPVWILAPAEPASSVTRRSTAVWMSSSDSANAKVPSTSSVSTASSAARTAVDLVGREDPRPAEAAHVGPAAGDVVGEQALVERQADGVGQQVLGRPGLEPSVPERVAVVAAGRGHGRDPGPCRCDQVSMPRPQSRTKPAESSWRKLSSAS